MIVNGFLCRVCRSRAQAADSVGLGLLAMHVKRQPFADAARRSTFGGQGQLLLLRVSQGAFRHPFAAQSRGFVSQKRDYHPFQENAPF